MNTKIVISILLCLLMVGIATADSAYDASVTLENKNATWVVLDNDNTSATVEYNISGEEFEYNVTAEGLIGNEDYCLIYYADKPDRFAEDQWGGNNPGALIMNFSTTMDGGLEWTAGSINLGMNLPHSNDWNIDPGDEYCNGSDNFTHCCGAKLWIVPASNYSVAYKNVTTWAHRNTFLFETDLIWYIDTTGNNVYDTSVTLENKNSTWAVLTEDNTFVTIQYNESGEEFEYSLEATGLIGNEDYYLIYYADRPDRFNEDQWGGDNPGALIAEFLTTTTGEIRLTEGSIELDMNLPHSDDWNINPGNEYCNDNFDNFNHCCGAKLWLIPASNYNTTINKLITWEYRNTFLFETDLIWYDDTDINEEPYNKGISCYNEIATDEEIIMKMVVCDEDGLNDLETMTVTANFSEYGVIDPVVFTMAECEDCGCICREYEGTVIITEAGHISTKIIAMDSSGNYTDELIDFEVFIGESILTTVEIDELEHPVEIGQLPADLTYTCYNQRGNVMASPDCVTVWSCDDLGVMDTETFTALDIGISEIAVDVCGVIGTGTVTVYGVNGCPEFNASEEFTSFVGTISVTGNFTEDGNVCLSGYGDPIESWTNDTRGAFVAATENVTLDLAGEGDTWKQNGTEWEFYTTGSVSIVRFGTYALINDPVIPDPTPDPDPTPRKRSSGGGGLYPVDMNKPADNTTTTNNTTQAVADPEPTTEPTKDLPTRPGTVSIVTDDGEKTVTVTVDEDGNILPGFSVIMTILGLISVAYIVNRRRD